LLSKTIFFIFSKFFKTPKNLYIACWYHHIQTIWRHLQRLNLSCNLISSSVSPSSINGIFRFELKARLLSQNILTIHHLELKPSSVSSLQHQIPTVSLSSSKTSKNSSLSFL
jgi:hypothetical protein